tara:strand:- start:231 stop:1331 length:1101 start_codon:yes stop_codon:yes gene_type:complete
LFEGFKMNLTSLYEAHIKLNAKIMLFSGYKMPITYQKITNEYNEVRNNCGIFDVSHMGQIHITGDDCINFIQYITVNDVNKINNYEAQYSAMCNLDAGIIDDLIIFKFSNKDFIIIVNASNTNAVLQWMKIYQKNFNINIKLMNKTHSLIALQGPQSRNILNKICSDKITLPFYNFMETQLLDDSVILTRTGYTGELGFEILAEHHIIQKLWDYFIDYGVSPSGLAVRDILRMEMKYCLYGNDISHNTNPLEAGLSWIVNLDKGDFLGKDSLLKFKNNQHQRRLIGFKMIEKAIPRKGYIVYVNNQKIGEVTSGTHSPHLSKGIGLAYIDNAYNQIGKLISIEIRGKLMNANIVKTPFIKNTSLHK